MCVYLFTGFETFVQLSQIVVPAGTLAFLFEAQKTTNDANNKRFEETMAANDKRFADMLSYQQGIRATDEKVLFSIVDRLSNDIKISNDLTNQKLQHLTENTLRLERLIESKIEKKLE